MADEEEIPEGPQWLDPVEHFRQTNSFYNPYDSREEFIVRRDAFLKEQLTFFEEAGITPKMVEDANHDLTNLLDGFSYQMVGGPTITNTSLARRVFGDFWPLIAERKTYRSDDKGAIEEIHTKRDVFQPGQVLYFGGVPTDDEGVFATYEIKLNQLTPEDIEAYSQMARKIHDLFSFSEVHYGRLNTHPWQEKPNPFLAFLRDLLRVGSRLNPSAFPEECQEGIVVGFERDVVGQDYVLSGIRARTTDGRHRPDLSPEPLLSNCNEETYENLVSPGDNIWYVTLPQGPHEWDSISELVRIQKE